MKTGIIQQANTGNIQENRLSLKQKIARQKTPAISTLQLQFPEKQPHSIAK